MRIYLIQSCGKRHAYCKECRPEVSDKIAAAHLGKTYHHTTPRSAEHRAKLSAAFKGRAAVVFPPENNPLGHTHPYCKECKPETAAHVSAKMVAGRDGQSWAKGVAKSAEHKAKLSAALKGRTLSLEHKTKVVAATTKRRREHGQPAGFTAKGRVLSLEDRKLRSERMRQQQIDGKMGVPKSNTAPERALLLLLAEFPVVETQVHFGPYHVDAYLPHPYHLAFEADGDYWHSLPKVAARDLVRDAYLLKEFSLPVVRFSERELKEVTLVNG